MVNFGPLTTEFTRLMFAHPKSTVCATQDGSTLQSRISWERITQSTSVKRRYQLRSLPRSTKQLVNFGPLTRTFTWLMFTHPKWTLRVLCRLMHCIPRWRSWSKISAPKLYPQSELRPRAASRWALPHISSLVFVFFQLESPSSRSRKTKTDNFRFRFSY